MPKQRSAVPGRPSNTGRTGREEQPDQARERDLETGVKDSFPASDALSATNVQGTRAVPPERILRDEATQPEVAGATRLAARFPDHEAAKLAIEALVREVPLDRHRAELTEAPGGAATVTVLAAPGEAERLRALLAHHGGHLVAEPGRSA
jgi:hypothetical protein